jgi:imidazolonepropionase-like amidohydrolase
LLVDGDPLADITILQKADRLLAVMKDGQFHKSPQIAETRFSNNQRN